MFNGTFLVSHGGIVTVSMGYRLGILGYLALPELAREDPSIPASGGMNGALDTLEALRWVQKHIGSFGGDAGHVTLAGESAGANLACTHAHSPLSAGLFHQVVLESGPCTGPWGPNSTATSFIYGREFMRSVNASTLADLRELPVEVMFFNTTYWDPNFAVDNWFLTQLPKDAPLTLRGPGSRVILGGNSVDTTCAPSDFLESMNASGMFQQLISARASFSPVEAFELMEAYSPVPSHCTGGPSNKTALPCYLQLIWNMSRDAGVWCPNLFLAEKFRAAHTDAVYLYEFAFGPNRSYPHWSYHGDDVGYVWNFSWSQTALPSGKGVSKSRELAMSDRLMAWWGSFTNTGVPRYGGEKSHPETSWKAFNNHKKNYMRMNGPDTAGIQAASNFPQSDVCDFWFQFNERSAWKHPFKHMKHYDTFGLLC